jgi:hypothetical protein
VKTDIGAPKLELLARRIMERAQKLGIDPATLRDEVLMGRNYAVNPAQAAPLSLAGGNQHR